MYEENFDPAVFEKNAISESVRAIEDNIIQLGNISYLTNSEKIEIQYLLEKLKDKLYEFNIQDFDI